MAVAEIVGNKNGIFMELKVPVTMIQWRTETLQVGGQDHKEDYEAECTNLTIYQCTNNIQNVSEWKKQMN